LAETQVGDFAREAGAASKIARRTDHKEEKYTESDNRYTLS